MWSRVPWQPWLQTLNNIKLWILNCWNACLYLDRSKRQHHDQYWGQLTLQDWKEVMDLAYVTRLLLTPCSSWGNQLWWIHDSSCHKALRLLSIRQFYQSKPEIWQVSRSPRLRPYPKDRFASSVQTEWNTASAILVKYFFIFQVIVLPKARIECWPYPQFSL